MIYETRNVYKQLMQLYTNQPVLSQVSENAFNKIEIPQIPFETVFLPAIRQVVYDFAKAGIELEEEEIKKTNVVYLLQGSQELLVLVLFADSQKERLYPLSWKMIAALKHIIQSSKYYEEACYGIPETSRIYTDLHRSIAAIDSLKTIYEYIMSRFPEYKKHLF